MEDNYNEKLKELNSQYKSEVDRKKELDKELSTVKEELEKIESDFPKQIKDLKDQI